MSGLPARICRMVVIPPPSRAARRILLPRHAGGGDFLRSSQRTASASSRDTKNAFASGKGKEANRIPEVGDLAGARLVVGLAHHQACDERGEEGEGCSQLQRLSAGAP